MLGRGKNKKSPSLLKMRGQDLKYSCGATLLDASIHFHTPIFDRYTLRLITERLSVSHTPKESSLPSFPIALGSPFDPAFFTVITPPTVLCAKRGEIYLLFLIGFASFDVFIIIALV